MALTFTPRTGVSIVHGSSVDDTVRLLRLLELSHDLDLETVVEIRDGAGDASALANRMDGRASILTVPAGASDAEAHNAILARIMERGSQFAWILAPELVIEPLTLGTLVRHLRKVPDCAVVGANIDMTRSLARTTKAADVEAVVRTGALYRVATLESVGLFGDNDVVDGHDAQWSARARQAGWRVMVHRAAAPMLERAHG
jgi:GT2 family glycosyltransferase